MTKLVPAVFVLMACGSPAPAAAQGAMDVCDALAHPAHYQGKPIRVRGSMQDGVECPSGGILWVEAAHGDAFIGPYSPLPGNVSMIVAGTFHWTAGAKDPYTLDGVSFDSVRVEKPSRRGH